MVEREAVAAAYRVDELVHRRVIDLGRGPADPADEMVVMVVRAGGIDVDVAFGLEPLREAVLHEEVERPEHRRATEQGMLDPERPRTAPVR